LYLENKGRFLVEKILAKYSNFGNRVAGTTKGNIQLAKNISHG